MSKSRQDNIRAEAKGAVASLPNTVWAAMSFEDIRARVRRVIADATDDEVRTALAELEEDGSVHRRPQTPGERERDPDGWYAGLNLREHEIAATDLADWLEKEAPDRLWSVDGEPRIAGDVNLPCRGRELAAILRKLDGRLSVLGRADARPDEDLASLAEDDDGLVFELAWLSGDGQGERWQLAEDALSGEADMLASG